jgi:Ca2+-binding RTX toxin-like protein
MRRVLAVIAVAAMWLLPLPATAQTTYTCFGEPATVVGTPGDDEIGGDVVVGLAGEDSLGGRLVCAGKGNDRDIVGDYVNAGPGDDPEVYLRGGGSLAIGGSGNDKLWDRGLVGDPRQVWRGGEGHDTFIPDDGEDVFYGGAGDDRTSQEQGSFDGKTRQFGGEDNDSLFGGGGRDKLFGDDGDDTLRASDNDSVEDLVDGGAGFDICIVAAGDRAVNCEDVTVVG